MKMTMPLPVEGLDDTSENYQSGLPVQGLTPGGVAIGDSGRPRVVIDTSDTQPTKDDTSTTTAEKIFNRLLGLNGEERYQTWPEKLVRDALAAPHDAMTGQMPEYKVDPDTGEVHTSPQMIAGAQAVSALAGSGGLAGTTDATLGSAPFLRPALKFDGKLFKGKVGDSHMDVIPPELVPQFQKQAMNGEDISNYNFGFVNDKGHFLDREKALQYGIDSGIIDPQAGKFGALTSTLMSDTSKPGAAIEAVANSKPFYSTVENAVANAKQQNGDASQWLGYLKNQPGVKQEELEHLGLDKLNGNVTKDQLIKAVQKGQPQIGETFKGELKFNKNSKYALPEVIKAAKESGDTPGELEMVIANDDKAYSALTKKYPELANDEDWAEKVSKDVFGGDSMPTGTTKYHSYQLPGGENYREMLMTLPEKKQDTSWIDNVIKAKNEYGLGSKEHKEALNAPQPIPAETQNYKSSHWDEPNVLAHMRMNDRTIDGQKSLHLEEIQSDWHQAGRKQGYKQEYKGRNIEEIKNDVNKLQDEFRNLEAGKLNNVNEIEVAWSRHPELREKVRKLIDEKQQAEKIELSQKEAVPDAPFKKSWHELALKRALFEAASKGYDKLSWTPGEAQAARYDLSKSIDKLAYNPATGHLQGFKNKSMVLDNPSVSKEKLPDFVGKEVADKILNKPTSKIGINGSYHQLENADLKVGGEGMKGFYDKIIPKALEKLLKEHGVKVKQTGTSLEEASKKLREFETSLNNKSMTTEQRIEWNRLRDNIANSKNGSLHYIDIPQSLRDQALKRGFPLFSAGFPIPNESNN